MGTAQKGHSIMALATLGYGYIKYHTLTQHALHMHTPVQTPAKAFLLITHWLTHWMPCPTGPWQEPLNQPWPRLLEVKVTLQVTLTQPHRQPLALTLTLPGPQAAQPLTWVQGPVQVHGGWQEQGGPGRMLSDVAF